jgi:hypothetical protein
MTLRVDQLWRYPVRTLAGERVDSALLTDQGLPGDRTVHVRGPEGVRTSRRHHRLLGLRGTLGEDGRPMVDDHPWDSPEALVRVRAAAGEDAWLAAYDGFERFDVLPPLVATDSAIAAFGRPCARGSRGSPRGRAGTGPASAGHSEANAGGTAVRSATERAPLSGTSGQTP